jgi:hypothetical protein
MPQLQPNAGHDRPLAREKKNFSGRVKTWAVARGEDRIGCMAQPNGSNGRISMLKTSRTALFALGLATLAGSLVPAAATPGQVCYFGECRSSTGPATAPIPSDPDETRPIAQHGSWKVIGVGEGAMIVDEFDNGAKLAFLFYPDGKVGLMLSHPKWDLKRGDEVTMRVEVDGSGFRGAAVVKENGIVEVATINPRVVEALYRGRSGIVEVGQYSFEMTNLANAAAAIDSLVSYQKTATR